MKEESTYYIPFFIPIISLIVISFGLLIYFQKNMSASVPLPGSETSLSGTPALSDVAAEPLVLKWVTYSNATYTFSVEVPDGWNTEDYAQFYAGGGTLIAFSPDALPCKTCSYFQDGYFSIRIYNAQTSPESYARFGQLIKALGKSKELTAVTLDGNSGVLFENTVSVEYKGWVYEFILDHNKGNSKVTDSKIFQHVVTSLKFTDLKFTP